MTFRPGISGNKAGRPRGATAATLAAKVRRDVQKAIAPAAGTIVNLAVRNALNGDANAVAAVVNLLAATAQPTKQSGHCPATNSSQLSSD